MSNARNKLSHQDYMKQLDEEIQRQSQKEREEDRKLIEKCDALGAELKQLQAVYQTNMLTFQTLEKKHQEAQRKQSTPGSATVVSPKFK